jgi:hypothetical protein
MQIIPVLQFTDYVMHKNFTIEMLDQQTEVTLSPADFFSDEQHSTSLCVCVCVWVWGGGGQRIPVHFWSVNGALEIECVVSANAQ